MKQTPNRAAPKKQMQHSKHTKSKCTPPKGRRRTHSCQQICLASPAKGRANSWNKKGNLAKSPSSPTAMTILITEKVRRTHSFSSSRALNITIARSQLCSDFFFIVSETHFFTHRYKYEPRGTLLPYQTPPPPFFRLATRPSTHLVHFRRHVVDGGPRRRRHARAAAAAALEAEPKV